METPIARKVERAAIVLVPFGLIVFLAFSGGGFDAIVRDRLGIGVWWAILLATMLGVLGLGGISARARIVLGALAAFALWTGLSMIWSESADRSATELARVTTYLGVFVLAIALSRRGRLRLTVAAVAAAIGVVVTASLLSRLQPGLFPAGDTSQFIAAAQARLNYPLNYWNGLGIFVAIGAPLLVHFATNARHSVARAVSTALLPVFGLVLYLTLSRGGAVALAVALATLVALHPGRRALLPQIAIGAAGAAVLIWAAHARPAFVDGLNNDAAQGDGNVMTLIVLVVGLLAGIARLGVASLVDRWQTPQVPDLSRRTRLGLLAGITVVALAAAVALGVPGRVGDGWDQFKDPNITHSSARLGSASGNGRYQWWSAAVDAYSSSPVHGIGAGTFQFWWAREGTLPGQVVDAHSLYLETLGELGIVGFVLIMVVVAGGMLMTIRIARGFPPGRRRESAAAIAAAAAFATGAALDWAWELSVLPVAFLILIGAVLGHEATEGEGEPALTGRRARWALGAASVLAVVVILPSLLGTSAIRSSQEKANSNDLQGALDDANFANGVEPYSGAAALQKALVLEELGQLEPAADAALEATREESTNWQNWFALSGIERKLGHHKESAAAYEQARELNPLSTVFDRKSGQGRESG